jgi:hypothetical protein
VRAGERRLDAQLLAERDAREQCALRLRAAGRQHAVEEALVADQREVDPGDAGQRVLLLVVGEHAHLTGRRQPQRPVLARRWQRREARAHRRLGEHLRLRHQERARLRRRAADRREAVGAGAHRLGVAQRLEAEEACAVLAEHDRDVGGRAPAFVLDLDPETLRRGGGRGPFLLRGQQRQQAGRREQGSAVVHAGRSVPRARDPGKGRPHAIGRGRFRAVAETGGRPGCTGPAISVHEPTTLRSARLDLTAAPSE